MFRPTEIRYVTACRVFLCPLTLMPIIHDSMSKRTQNWDQTAYLLWKNHSAGISVKTNLNQFQIPNVRKSEEQMLTTIQKWMKKHLYLHTQLNNSTGIYRDSARAYRWIENSFFYSTHLYTNLTIATHVHRCLW